MADEILLKYSTAKLKISVEFLRPYTTIIKTWCENIVLLYSPHSAVVFFY